MFGVQHQGGLWLLSVKMNRNKEIPFPQRCPAWSPSHIYFLCPVGPPLSIAWHSPPWYMDPSSHPTRATALNPHWILGLSSRQDSIQLWGLVQGPASPKCPACGLALDLPLGALKYQVLSYPCSPLMRVLFQDHPSLPCLFGTCLPITTCHMVSAQQFW